MKWLMGIVELTGQFNYTEKGGPNNPENVSMQLVFSASGPNILVKMS
jgi:hypothetical protein